MVTAYIYLGHVMSASSYDKDNILCKRIPWVVI